MTTLDTLRAAGLKVRAEGDELVLRGRLTVELKALALVNKPQILTDLAEEAALVAFYSCPRCHVMDYCPVGDGRRRCLHCGQVFRDSRDAVSALEMTRDSASSASARPPGAPNGVGVHLEQVDDGDLRAPTAHPRGCPACGNRTWRWAGDRRRCDGPRGCGVVYRLEVVP